MSATYNWAYKPGVTNKYGITINPGEDDVPPSNAVYVALYGNDDTGNGSRLYPFRTIAHAVSVAQQGTWTYLIMGSGVYREGGYNFNISLIYFIGDGDVTIDWSYYTNGWVNFNLYSAWNCFSYNIKWIGGSVMFSRDSFGWTSVDSHYINCVPNRQYNNVFNSFTNCIIENYTDWLESYDNWNNVTIINCNNVFLYGNAKSCIFYNSNITLSNPFGALLYSASYNLFFQCNFRFSTAMYDSGVYPIYPSLPEGFFYYSLFSDLLSAAKLYFGVGSMLQSSIIGDPLFNNMAIGDYSLSFGSPAKNLSYFGTYVGARSVAYPVTISATESAGGFDFSTIENLSVSNNSITLVNPAQNGSIQTGLIANNSGRQLARLPVYGFNADRNGQYINSISDLSGSVQQAGDTLTVPTPYLVETGSITYNGSIYQPGDRLTTVEGVTSFSSDFGGTLREITEAPERHTIMMRCGNGGETVAAGSALIAGYWYYVISGSVTYNGTAYGGGQSFKAIGSGGFSGSGNVITALGPESFNHYEPGIQPTTNNEGDTRTGAILRGNGDPAYVRGGYGVQEFPINARFIQLYYIINVANLKP
jgi:hypothetical protein